LSKGLAKLKDQYYEEVYYRYNEFAISWPEALELSQKVAKARTVEELAELMGYSVSRVKKDLASLHSHR